MSEERVVAAQRHYKLARMDADTAARQHAEAVEAAKRALVEAHREYEDDQ